MASAATEDENGSGGWSEAGKHWCREPES